MIAVPRRPARLAAATGAGPRTALLALLLATGLGAAPAPAAPAAGTAAASQVVLPLSEYERLQNKPSVTVIDTLRITGSFQSKDLAIAFSGRAAGLLPRVEVLTGPSGVRIYECEGDAILSRTSTGSFELVPLGTRFTLRCRIATAGSDRLQLESAPSVLWVDSQVQDGELFSIEEARDNSGRRNFAIVRVTPGTSDIIKPSVTARYHITLQPEGTLFTYQFEVKNPNRSHQQFVVRMSSGEHVQTVDTSASYEPSGNEYVFQLPPGETLVKLSGTLQQPRLAPVVQASVQYLLFEHHPLLRPTITTVAQRISANETGLRSVYRGAGGFLLGATDTVAWQVAKLEALRTTSFAVHSAEHVFFLSSDGQALGESTIELDNQGAPALKLGMRAEPTFASLEQESVFLTKNSDGALWLPLSSGLQHVLIQYRQPLTRTLGLGFGTLWLPELDEPASTTRIQLRYEEQWVPLFEEFAPDVRVPALSVGGLVGLILLILLAERLLAAIGLRRGMRSLLALVVSAGALTSGWWLTLLLCAEVAGYGILVLPWLFSRKWNVWSVVIGLGLGGFICLMLSSVLFTSRSAAPMSDSRAPILTASETKEVPRAPTPTPATDKGDEPTAPPTYQGLPAKFAMPNGTNRSHFDRELLVTRARAVRVVMLSRPVLSALGDMLIGLGLLLLALQLGPLRRGIQERWQRVLRARRIAAEKSPERAPDRSPDRLPDHG